MDLTSFGFVGLVIALGGIIAFWADRLGRYLGKKRLSVFGMRPRHTAALLTIAAGVLIPLITVLIVVAASQDVRLWLVEGRQAVEKVKVLKGQVDEWEKKGATLDEEIQAKTTEAAELDAKLQATRADLARYRAEADRSARLAAAASRKVGELTRRAAQLTASLEEKTRTLTRKTDELVGVQANLAKVRSEYDALSDAFNVLSKDQEEAYKENRRLGMENDQLTRDAERLSSDISQMGQERDALQKETERLKGDLEQTQRQLERGKLDLDQLGAQLSAAASILQQNLNASRTRPMIFKIGEELARLSVPSSLTDTDARDALTSLLRSARILADQQGAKGDPSAGIWYRDTPERRVTIEEQEEAIVKGITGQKEYLVLVATSMLNAFQGEFVALDVKAYRNPLVYRAGQVISETRVNGQLSEDRILQQIGEFVTVQVRQQALDDRMIPIRGAENSLGEVSQEAVLELMRLIREASRLVRVQAVALQDTRAADPLKLEFRVR